MTMTGHARSFSNSHLAKRFDYATIVVDNKHLRGMRIVCAKCGAAETTRMNTFSTGKDDAHSERTERLATRRFVDQGWEVGDTAARHKCPHCAIQVVVPKKIQEEPTMQDANAMTAKLAVLPRTMGREDRRIVFEKLNETYQDEKTGYTPPWTDKKIAQDLGVPPAWVAQVRDEMFGPVNTNSEIDGTVAAGVKLVAELRAMVETLTREAASVKNKADDLEKRLIDIQKAMRP